MQVEFVVESAGDKFADGAPSMFQRFPAKTCTWSQFDMATALSPLSDVCEDTSIGNSEHERPANRSMFLQGHCGIRRQIGQLFVLSSKSPGTGHPSYFVSYVSGRAKLLLLAPGRKGHKATYAHYL